MGGRTYESLGGWIKPLLPSERFALLVSDPLFLLFLFFCIEKDHYFLPEHVV